MPLDIFLKLWAAKSNGKKWVLSRDLNNPYYNIVCYLFIGLPNTLGQQARDDKENVGTEAGN